MIRKLKPFHASVVIETRRPIGLFYVYEDGVYVGIDNSTGHAWTEEFTNLHQCKEWLRNPSMPSPSMEEETEMDRITKPEELVAYAARQGIPISIGEADILLGYMEGHDYCLMLDGSDAMLRHDEQDGADHNEDLAYSIPDAVIFCLEMNEELLRENKSQEEPDTCYLSQPRKDGQILDALMEKVTVVSRQNMEAA